MLIIGPVTWRRADVRIFSAVARRRGIAVQFISAIQNEEVGEWPCSRTVHTSWALAHQEEPQGA